MYYNKKETAKRLRSLRKQYGFPEQAIADLLCTTIKTYRKIENGETELRFLHLLLLADFYQVSTDFIIISTEGSNTKRNK